MTSIKKDSGVEYIKLSEHVNPEDIYKVVDYGAVVSIAAVPGKVDSVREECWEKTSIGIPQNVFTQLKSVGRREETVDLIYACDPENDNIIELIDMTWSFFHLQRFDCALSTLAFVK